MVAFNSAIVFCASASISARSRFHCRRSSESTFRNSLQSIGLLCLEARFPRGAFFGELARSLRVKPPGSLSFLSQATCGAPFYVYSATTSALLP
jgi:hypothetical protein